MTLQTSLGYEIERPVSTVFRRAAIKRRQTADGLYESSWLDITDFIKSWGSFESAVDDIRLNRFTFSGLTLRCRNDNGDFNPENHIDSLWNGYLTRYRTLVRIQAGYNQDDSTELPTETTQGIFVLDGEVTLDAQRFEAILNCKSLTTVFEEVRANELTGVYTTQTASDIFARIRDHSDGSSRFVFRQFITSTAWSIAATTINYVLSTSAAIADLSVWDLMNKLAEAEGYVVFLTRSGGINFQNRDPNTSTVALNLNGQGTSRPNVIAISRYAEAIDKYHNFIRLRYLSADTTTSFLTAGTITTVDPSNASWKYGNKIYEFENTFFSDTTTAQNAINAILNNTAVMKSEVDLDALFIPQLDISDRVSLTYFTYNFEDASLWDASDWASDAAVSFSDGMNWDKELGETFNFNNRHFRVLSKSTNLDKFTTEFKLREI